VTARREDDRGPIVRLQVGYLDTGDVRERVPDLPTHGLSLAERTRVQGLTDGLIWSSAAAASLGSGVVVAAASYAALGLLGAALVVVPVLLVFARRSAVAGQATA
jgi:hypothetical protein